jgi:hypothetical protein
VTFPRVDGKIKKIEMPEDVYVKMFFKKHPDSLYHDAIKYVPSRVLCDLHKKNYQCSTCIVEIVYMYLRLQIFEGGSGRKKCSIVIYFLCTQNWCYYLTFSFCT